MRLTHAGSSDLWLAPSRPFPKSEIILILLPPSTSAFVSQPQRRESVPARDLDWPPIAARHFILWLSPCLLRPCNRSLEPLLSKAALPPLPHSSPCFQHRAIFSCTRKGKFNSMRSLCLDIPYPHLTSVCSTLLLQGQSQCHLPSGGDDFLAGC